jgi:hypothetical protein
VSKRGGSKEEAGLTEATISSILVLCRCRMEARSESAQVGLDRNWRRARTRPSLLDANPDS